MARRQDTSDGLTRVYVHQHAPCSVAQSEGWPAKGPHRQVRVATGVTTSAVRIHVYTTLICHCHMSSATFTFSPDAKRDGK